MFLHAAHVDLNAALAAIDRDADRRLAVIANRIRSRSTHQLRAGAPLDLSAEHAMLADLIERVMVASHLRSMGIHQPAYALARSEIDKALSKAPKHVRTALRELYGSIARSIADKPMSVVRDRLLTQAKDVATGKKGKGGDIRAAVRQSGIEFEDTPVLRTVIRTQASIAFNAATFEAGQTNDEVWGYQYMTQADERVRETHREFEPNGVGVRYRFDDPFWDRYAPPNGWRCFAPDTLIDPIGDVGWISKSWYTGELVEIETFNGHRLSVTANHPIATPGGWVAATMLQEGDDLFCNRSEVELVQLFGFPDHAGRTITYQQRPARVDDIFESFAAHGRRSVKITPLDFHGDGQFTVGEIDVVFPDRKLMQQFDAAFIQQRSNDSLARPDERLVFENSLSTEYSFSKRTPPPRGGVPRRRALAMNRLAGFFDGSPFQEFGLRLSSEDYAAAFEESANQISTNTKTMRQRVDALSSLVSLNHFIGTLRFPDFLNMPRPNGHASAMEKMQNSLTIDAKEFRQRLNCLSPLISSDHVIRIRRSPHRGHVFNLQSETGFIISNGVLTSNCRCGLRLIFRGDKDARKREFKGTPDVPESFQFNPGQFFSLVQATKAKQKKKATQ